MKNKTVSYLAQASAIAAIYVVVTTMFSAISFGEVQVRISEALTVLPFFTGAAVPGLFVGCLLANILGGGIPLDVLLGSLATLLGAFLTWHLRGKSPLLAPLPPIAANTLIVPFILRFGYGINLPVPFMMLTVGIGEIVSCGVLGLILLKALSSYGKGLFQTISG